MTKAHFILNEKGYVKGVTFECSNCSKTNAKFYKGALGYEAIECPDCGATEDANGIHLKETIPAPLSKPKSLICTCCGQYHKGRQWWNMDAGYGLCIKCVPYCREKETAEEFALTYGEVGVHILEEFTDKGVTIKDIVLGGL